MQVIWYNLIKLYTRVRITYHLIFMQNSCISKSSLLTCFYFFFFFFFFNLTLNLKWGHNTTSPIYSWHKCKAINVSRKIFPQKSTLHSVWHKKTHNICRKEYFTQKISILFKNLATYRKNSIKMSPSEWLYIKGVIHADMGFHLNQSIFISDIIYGLSWKT